MPTDEDTRTRFEGSHGRAGEPLDGPRHRPHTGRGRCHRPSGSATSKSIGSASVSYEAGETEVQDRMAALRTLAPMARGDPRPPRTRSGDRPWMSLSEFWVHEATVSTFEGSGPFGEERTPTRYRCRASSMRHESSSVTRRAAKSSPKQPSPAPSNTDPLFAPESLVEVRGRTATVLTQAIRTGGDLDLPDHFEATTT